MEPVTYLMHVPGSDLYKAGATIRVVRRLEEVGDEIAVDVDLVGFVSSTLLEEPRFLSFLAQHPDVVHVWSEWFRIPDPDRAPSLLDEATSWLRGRWHRFNRARGDRRAWAEAVAGVRSRLPSEERERLTAAERRRRLRERRSTWNTRSGAGPDGPT